MDPSNAAGRGGPAWQRATLSGLSASLVGIGLARFAYTPLIPVLIAAAWFAPAEAAYLGAANLAGYLAGALAARPLAARLAVDAVLRGMMLLAAASFVACAAPLSFAWFFAWRFAAGIAGGVLMVLTAPTILPHVPAARRGLAGGAIFAGVGIGIAASGTLVPMLLTLGVAETWLGLGALAFVLTAVAWNGWPRGTMVLPAAAAVGTKTVPALKALYVGYGLVAVGLVPHMVFLVDFVARGLGQGVEVGARYWMLFGLGAIAGPVLLGHLADRIGFRLTLRLAYAAQAVSVALLALSSHAAALIVSSAVIGAFVPGITALTLGRVQELAPDVAARQKAWSVLTIAFAAGQAAAAYACSYLFAATGGAYVTLFAVGAGAVALAFLLDLAAGSRRRGDFGFV